MGSNDHVPVPDPKVRVLPDEPLGAHSSNNFVHVTGRLNNLERSRESYDLQVAGLLSHILDQGKSITSLEISRNGQEVQSEVLRNSIINIVRGMASLTRLLKQTSRGVERLAQGHSAGNLGLPTFDDWDEMEI